MVWNILLLSVINDMIASKMSRAVLKDRRANLKRLAMTKLEVPSS